jgi:xylan 1,4-beta-xylosidase
VVPPSGKTDQVYYNQDLPPQDKGTLQLDLDHVPNGRYHLAAYQTGYKHNDAFTAYVEMGSPKQLTRAQVDQLKKLNDGAPISQEEVSIKGGHFSRTLPLRTNDVFFIVLTPAK